MFPIENTPVTSFYSCQRDLQENLNRDAFPGWTVQSHTPRSNHLKYRWQPQELQKDRKVHFSRVEFPARKLSLPLPETCWSPVFWRVRRGYPPGQFSPLIL